MTVGGQHPAWLQCPCGGFYHLCLLALYCCHCSIWPIYSAFVETTRCCHDPTDCWLDFNCLIVCAVGHRDAYRFCFGVSCRCRDFHGHGRGVCLCVGRDHVCRDW